MKTREPHPRPFKDLGFSPAVTEGITEAGFAQALPVQVACAAPALEGRDVVVRSKTGSGKTLAFAAPVLSLIDYGVREVQALVLVPTRELAVQVHEQFERIGRRTGLRSVAVYGGTGFGRQLDMLRSGVHLVVGTPGRVLDHQGRGTLDLSNTGIFVLDEADEMLSAGFYEDIIRVFDALKGLEQVMLFSATLSGDTGKIVSRHLEDPVHIDLSTDRVDVDRIENIAYPPCDQETTRQQLLVSVLEAEDPGAAIIFCNTRSDTESVTSYLKRRGFDAIMLNSDLSQPKREQVMARMKEGRHRLLVATDIAARGIDISQLPCVINYEPPEDPGLYIHRTGRTGRVDRKGRAITLLMPRDVIAMNRIKSLYGLTVAEERQPDREETLRMLSDRRMRELKEKLELGPVIPDEFRTIAKDVIADPRAEEIVSLLVDHFLAEAPQPPAPLGQHGKSGGGGRGHRRRRR
jgi:ATP-dependent RNA helicase DeaD